MNCLKTTSYNIAIAIVFFTCCKSSTVVDYNESMKTIGDVKIIKDKLIAAFGADKMVYNTSIMRKDNKSNEFIYGDISYVENGIDMSQNYVTTPEERVSPPKAKILQNPFFLKNAQGAVALKDLNFDQIPVKVKEAIALISADYKDFYLNKWGYTVDNANKVTANFTIEMAKKREKSEPKGRREIPNYYETNFKMDDSGKVTLVN